VNYVKTVLLSLVLIFSATAVAQITDTFNKSNLELSGGWAHSTGDLGVSGLNAGAALWFNRRVTIAFDYDYLQNTSTLGNFGLTTAGLITIRTRLQNFLIGPRIFFGRKEIKKYKIDPFAELQVGGSHLSQSLSQVNVGSQSAAGTDYDWLLGGGAQYQFSPHWAARGNLDFFRTHFANQGQSRLRFVLGVAYTFRARYQH